MTEQPISPRQMQELLALARSGPGSKLLSMLMETQGPRLKDAMSRQDYDTAKRILRDFMERPDVKDLLRQLKG